MQLLDRESALSQEYWNLSGNYTDSRISKAEYIAGLKDLNAKYDSLLEEGYANRWDTYDPYFFKSIYLSKGSIEHELAELEQ